jgi:hypothetical protein
MKLATALWLCVIQFVIFFFAGMWSMVYRQPLLTIFVCFVCAIDWFALAVYLLYRWAKLTESLDVNEDDVRLTGYATQMRTLQNSLGAPDNEGSTTQDLPRLP